MSRRGGCALPHSEHALILSFCFRYCFLFVCYRSNQSKQYELFMETKAKKFFRSFLVVDFPIVAAVRRTKMVAAFASKRPQNRCALSRPEKTTGRSARRGRKAAQ